MSALPKVFVLGDSISIQYGPHLQRMLAGQFSYARKTGDEALRNLDIPEGANGGDSRMCLAFLRDLLQTASPDANVLLLNCGLHDIKADPHTGATQVPLDEYTHNLRQIVELLADPGSPQLVWVRTTPVYEPQHNTPEMGFHRFNRDVDRYNRAADELMAARGVATIDLHGFTSSLGDPAELMTDGRHYAEPVQKLQAGYIAGWLDAWRNNLWGRL